MKSFILAILLLLITSQILATKIKNKSRNKLRIKHRHRHHSSSRMKVKQDVPAVVFEGWLRIASESFQDPQRYPNVPQPKNKRNPEFPVQILGDKKTDEDFKVEGYDYNGVFRKNTQFADGAGVAPAIDAFYFRLSGHNLYYTETDADAVVLGAISVHNVKSTSGAAPSCFTVTDDEADNWTLCTVDGSPTSDWICPISEILGLPCPEEGEAAEVQVKKVQVTQPLLIVPLPSPDCARDWNYNFHGNNWVCKCNEGREQSPIDLPVTACLPLVKTDAEFEYKLVKKGDVLIVYHLNILRFIPKHAKVNMGKLSDVDGTEYAVSEVLLHTPAEHTIAGKKFDAELQVIHKCIKGEFKMKAVLAVLYKKRPGSVVQAFEEMDILNLPNPLFKEGNNLLSKDFHIMKFIYNDDVYNSPPPFDYYKYRGSFTFPPCEEDVVWFVLEDPVMMGTTTWSFLRDVPNPPKLKGPKKDCGGGKAGVVTYADNFDGTNRDVQPVRDRQVFFFDRTKGCNPFTPKPKPPSGHYEKLEQKGVKYFYVDGDKPSGIPGALVISQSESEGKVPPPRGPGDRFGVHE